MVCDKEIFLYVSGHGYNLSLINERSQFSIKIKNHIVFAAASNLIYGLLKSDSKINIWNKYCNILSKNIIEHLIISDKFFSITINVLEPTQNPNPS